MFLLKGSKTNWKYILLILILAVIAGGGIFGYIEYSNKEIISLTKFSEVKKPEKVVEEKTKPKEEKPTISIEEVQSTLTSLIGNLKGTIKIVNQGNISLISESLENYKKKFSEFSLKSNQLEIEKILDKNLITNLRRSEWENYKLFLDLEKLLSNHPQFSQKITEIEDLIESELKTQILKSVEILTPKTKASSYLEISPFSKVINFFLVYAADLQKIIHKKVFSGENWKYESWIELETGNIRQEIKIKTTREIISEIDITDGETGKKLALNPEEKLAEWLDPKKGKHGIGDEETKDPFTVFKTNLEEGKCSLEGVDIVENKEVYLVECPFYEREYFRIKGECTIEGKEFGKKCISQGEICEEEILDPNKEIYTLKCLDYEIIGDSAQQWGHYNTKEYKLFYIDVQIYFPIKELVYEEHLYLEEKIPNEFKLYKTLNFSYQFEGEIIDRESLPADFFELEIPSDYKLQEWTPYG